MATTAYEPSYDGALPMKPGDSVTIHNTDNAVRFCPSCHQHTGRAMEYSVLKCWSCDRNGSYAKSVASRALFQQRFSAKIKF
jgi:ribosomal protein L37AE/L43A